MTVIILPGAVVEGSSCGVTFDGWHSLGMDTMDSIFNNTEKSVLISLLKI